jgi:regulator of cell morphogenesis and NO signaling
MSIDTTSLVDQLATASSVVTRYLCRVGIDVHGQGGLTLAEACSAQALPLDKVAKELEALKQVPQRDWMRASIPELVHHIVHHHHAFTREELIRIQNLLDRAVATPGPSLAILTRIKVHFAALARDLVAHFLMEERNLFPALCAADNGGETPISLSTPSEQARTVSAEHHAVEELRIIYLGLRNLEDDLHLHLFLENHILFPRALPH